MDTSKRLLYITSLLSETLPIHMIDDTLIQEMGLGRDHTFVMIHLLFSNKLRQSIETTDEALIADWKSGLHIHMQAFLEAPFIESIDLLNLAPFTRTLVLGLKAHEDVEVDDHLLTWFQKTNSLLDQEGYGRIIAFTSTRHTPLSQIGKLYKDLRKMAGYRYILGMGQLAYYEAMDFKEAYSLTEYKYIKQYETLMEENHYQALLPLLTTLKTYLTDHAIPDSKVIYVYKELIAITIRHLYTDETAYLRLIESLNHAILHFDLTFDDLFEVHAYMLRLMTDLMDLKKDTALSGMHPHVNKVLRYISKHYMEEITLNKIADDLSLSVPYLSRLFAEHMQMNFKTYLIKYRLDHVKSLLLSTDLAISDIAKEVGYEDPNQLTRIFRKYEKTTPRTYRQMGGL